MDLRDEREGRPVRVSGAFDLDMSKVTEEAARRAAEQVGSALSTLAEHLLQAIMPALAKINHDVEELTRLLAAQELNDADAVGALTSMLPSGVPMAQDVARFQHQRLAEAGYAVMAMFGPAQAHARKVAEYQRGERHPSVDRAHATLEGRGLVPPRHRVDSLLDSGVQGVDVDQYEATARVDARLAQARRDGQEDSWHEPHE